MTSSSTSGRVMRLAVGLVLVGGLFGLLAFGPMWPGFAGRMIQRNVDQDVQATALFYQDLEAMTNLEDRLDRIQARQR